MYTVGDAYGGLRLLPHSNIIERLPEEFPENFQAKWGSEGFLRVFRISSPCSLARRRQGGGGRTRTRAVQAVCNAL